MWLVCGLRPEAWRGRFFFSASRRRVTALFASHSSVLFFVPRINRIRNRKAPVSFVRFSLWWCWFFLSLCVWGLCWFEPVIYMHVWPGREDALSQCQFSKSSLSLHDLLVYYWLINLPRWREPIENKLMQPAAVWVPSISIPLWSTECWVLVWRDPVTAMRQSEREKKSLRGEGERRESGSGDVLTVCCPKWVSGSCRVM